MKKLILLLTVLSQTVLAQTDWSAIEIKTNPINERIAFLEGSGGNIGVLYGDEGVMIVDDQYAELSDKIRIALGELSVEDLRFVVNTHYHGDHSGGNENMAAAGATIVAHQKVRERLGTSFYNVALDRQMTAKPETYWPTITFKDDISFHLNGEDVTVEYIPNAHTDGDAVVYFETSNILHTGDVFVRYGFPYIDASAGGSIDGLIAAQQRILEIANPDTQIVPGHGQLSTTADVQELLDLLTKCRSLIVDLKAEGKSLDETLTANPLEKYDEQWSGSFIDTALFTRLVYETLPE